MYLTQESDEKIQNIIPVDSFTHINHSPLLKSYFYDLKIPRQHSNHLKHHYNLHLKSQLMKLYHRWRFDLILPVLLHYNREFNINLSAFDTMKHQKTQYVCYQSKHTMLTLMKAIIQIQISISYGRTLFNVCKYLYVSLSLSLSFLV